MMQNGGYEVCVCLRVNTPAAAWSTPSLQCVRNNMLLVANGPLQVIAQRLSKLGTFKKSGAPERQPAEVLIKRKKRGRNGDFSWEIVRARGHLDEVLEMRKGGTKLGKRVIIMLGIQIKPRQQGCRHYGIDIPE